MNRKTQIFLNTLWQAVKKKIVLGLERVSLVTWLPISLYLYGVRLNPSFTNWVLKLVMIIAAGVCGILIGRCILKLFKYIRYEIKSWWRSIKSTSDYEFASEQRVAKEKLKEKEETERRKKQEAQRRSERLRMRIRETRERLLELQLAEDSEPKKFIKKKTKAKRKSAKKIKVVIEPQSKNRLQNID